MTKDQENSVVLETELPNPLFCRGKVRDTYDLGDHLLIVTTDRISAFDVILPCGIPNKGMVLTKLSSFWFDLTSHLMPNHFIEVVGDSHLLDGYIPPDVCYAYPSYLAGRSMIVKKAKVIPVECVVRGYLAGSAWEEYSVHGTANGIPLRSGLKQCQQLDEPLFTPTTKADIGHDLPLSKAELHNMVGETLAKEIEEKSLALYDFAEKYARERGIIIADTKVELGMIDGELAVVDELFTPDSSRFWDIEIYQAGQPQPSFDKQIVRDHLAESGWDKEPPAPMLPLEVIDKTARKYIEVYSRLTGKELLES